MLHLNLLAVEKKSKLEQLIKFLFTKNILEIILLFFALLAIVHVWAWVLVIDQFGSLSESANSVNQDRFTYNPTIKEINSRIKDIAMASRGYIKLSPKLVELADLVPGTIKIAAISIDRRQNTFIISGTAKHREALLEFQNTLQNIPWLEKGTAPLSQFFTPTEISFEIKTKLKNFPTLPAKPTIKTPAPISHD